jgi:hypothetical protein
LISFASQTTAVALDAEIETGGRRDRLLFAAFDWISDNRKG